MTLNYYTFITKLEKSFVYIIILQLVSRPSDDTVSMVHYPPRKLESPVSASGAGDWYVKIDILILNFS